ncbi:MAG: hypothetical protein ACYDDF_15280 [Thermoplasmatota archaeon]
MRAWVTVFVATMLLAGCMIVTNPKRPAAEPCNPGVTTITGQSAVTSADLPASAPRGISLVFRLRGPTIACAGTISGYNLTLANEGTAPVWTNPSVICVGSWDIVFRNATSGQTIATDDRASMGCAAGGTLQTQVSPGQVQTFNYAWDGFVHQDPLRRTLPSPWAYDVSASALFAWSEGTFNREGNATHTVLTNLSLRVCSAPC